MKDTLVRLGFGIVLCALVKGDVFCPLEEQDAVSRFNVLCDMNSPCHDLNIYCPKSAYTDLLWLDCQGAHACVNISVYSTVPTRVRCRSRTGSCDNVNIYCGDDVSAELPSTASSSTVSLFTSEEGNQVERAVTCRMRHMDPYVTQNSFFGCYGDVELCEIVASADNAYTDSRMHCATTGGPCVMQCLTSLSCSNNELQCAATDQNSCQCQTEANCAAVETIDARDDPETTEATDPSTTESVSSSTTQMEQSSTSVSTTDSATTEVETTQATQPSQASSTTVASTTTEPSSTSSTTQQEQTTSTEASSTTQISSTDTVSTTSTTSVVESTSTSVSSSTTSTTATATSSTVSTIDNFANRQETKKDNSHVMKPWQLGLAIVLPIVGAAIVCLIGAYVLKRWKKDNPSSTSVKEESAPHKSVSAQSIDGLMSPTNGLTTPATISTTEV